MADAAEEVATAAEVCVDFSRFIATAYYISDVVLCRLHGKRNTTFS